MNPIPYGKQHISDEDIEAVVATLRATNLTQGPKIPEFEQAFADYIGSKYALAVSNGTAALHMCTLALGVQPGQKVITTPITFVASANCVRFCEGEVVFADIDPDTFLLDIVKVRELLEAAPKGTYSGIIPVDFAGKAVNLEEFRALADEFDLWIIEDACHSPGGYFMDSQGKKQKCGNGEFADLAIFSFHPVKHIACGEGGMITTNNKELYEKLLKFRSHGIIKDDEKYLNEVNIATGEQSASSDDAYPRWYMEMQELGYNYRLTDFQAALGISQLNRADAGLERRHEIAKYYDQAFQGHPQISSQLNELQASPSGHAFHLYIINAENRLGLFNHLRNHQIFVQIHYIPAHLMPYYKQFGWKKGDLPEAEKYYTSCLSLPIFPTLTWEEQDFVIKTIFEFYSN
jgi:UDP-4-amino-4,6-dideoxy-N-acetyl-beta-L-altrosamine transaminase